MEEDKQIQHIKRADQLLLEYTEKVKPLIKDVLTYWPSKRTPVFITSEIVSINNHLSHCFGSNKESEQIEIELDNVDKQLKTLECTLYRTLFILMHDKILWKLIKYEKMHCWYNPEWALLRTKIIKLKKETIEAVKESHLAAASGENINNLLSLYEIGYRKYKDLEELMINRKMDFVRLRIQSLIKESFVIKALIAALVTLITTIAVYCFTAFIL